VLGHFSQAHAPCTLNVSQAKQHALTLMAAELSGTVSDLQTGCNAAQAVRLLTYLWAGKLSLLISAGRKTIHSIPDRGHGDESLWLTAVTICMLAAPLPNGW